MSAKPPHSNGLIYLLIAVTLMADIAGCSMRYQPPASAALTNSINQSTEEDLQAAGVDDAFMDAEFCPHSAGTTN
jgi:hypothetical protein